MEHNFNEGVIEAKPNTGRRRRQVEEKLIFKFLGKLIHFSAADYIYLRITLYLVLFFLIGHNPNSMAAVEACPQPMVATQSTGCILRRWRILYDGTGTCDFKNFPSKRPKLEDFLTDLKTCSIIIQNIILP